MAEKVLQTAFDECVKASGSKDGKLAPDCLKKWFKEADKSITDKDVDAAIAKSCKDKKGFDFNDVKTCATTLCKEKKMEPKEFMEKLASSCPVKKEGVAGIADAGAKCLKGDKDKDKEKEK